MIEHTFPDGYALPTAFDISVGKSLEWALDLEAYESKAYKPHVEIVRQSGGVENRRLGGSPTPTVSINQAVLTGDECEYISAVGYLTGFGVMGFQLPSSHSDNIGARSVRIDGEVSFTVDVIETEEFNTISYDFIPNITEVYTLSKLDFITGSSHIAATVYNSTLPESNPNIAGSVSCEFGEGIVFASNNKLSTLRYSGYNLNHTSYPLPTTYPSYTAADIIVTSDSLVVAFSGGITVINTYELGNSVKQLSSITIPASGNPRLLDIDGKIVVSGLNGLVALVAGNELKTIPVPALVKAVAHNGTAYLVGLNYLAYIPDLNKPSISAINTGTLSFTSHWVSDYLGGIVAANQSRAVYLRHSLCDDEILSYELPVQGDFLSSPTNPYTIPIMGGLLFADSNGIRGWCDGKSYYCFSPLEWVDCPISNPIYHKWHGGFIIKNDSRMCMANPYPVGYDRAGYQAALLKIVDTGSSIRPSCYTDFDRDVSYGRYPYFPSLPFSLSSIRCSSGQSTETCEIKFNRESAQVDGLINEYMVRNRGYFSYKATVTLVNVGAIQSPYAAARQDINNWDFGEVTATDTEITVELRGYKNRLQNKVTLKTSPLCPYTFGGRNCGVNLNSRAQYSYVVDTDGRSWVRIDKPSAWYIPAPYHLTSEAAGYILPASGANAGNPINVKAIFDEGSTIRLELWYKSLGDFAVGDFIAIYPSCNKTMNACQAYANFENFGGFPYVPGTAYYVAGTNLAK